MPKKDHESKDNAPTAKHRQTPKATHTNKGGGRTKPQMAGPEVFDLSCARCTMVALTAAAHQRINTKKRQGQGPQTLSEVTAHPAP